MDLIRFDGGERMKFKYVLGAQFEIEAENKEEADKKAEEFEPKNFELVPMN